MPRPEGRDLLALPAPPVPSKAEGSLSRGAKPKGLQLILQCPEQSERSPAFLSALKRGANGLKIRGERTLYSFTSCSYNILNRLLDF